MFRVSVSNDGKAVGLTSSLDRGQTVFYCNATNRSQVMRAGRMMDLPQQQDGGRSDEQVLGRLRRWRGVAPAGCGWSAAGGGCRGPVEACSARRRRRRRLGEQDMLVTVSVDVTADRQQ